MDKFEPKDDMNWSVLESYLSGSRYCINNFKCKDICETIYTLNGNTIKVGIPEDINKSNDYDLIKVNVFIETIIKVINNNADILCYSEMMSHGYSYASAKILLKNIQKHLELFMDSYIPQSYPTSCQIIISSENLYECINRILNEISYKTIIMTLNHDSTSILSLGILVDLLMKEGNCLNIINKLMLLPQKELKLLCSSVTLNSLDVNDFPTIVDNVKVINRCEKSAFLVLDDCDIFSCAISLLETLPAVCFVQENIYEELIKLLQRYGDDQNEHQNILNRNRRWDLKRRRESDCLELGMSMGPIRDIRLIVGGSISQLTNKEIYSSVCIVDGIDSESEDHHIFSYCYLFTFRHAEEAAALTNKVIPLHQQRGILYLWGESIGGPLLALTSVIDWREIYVNASRKQISTLDVSLFWQRCGGGSCDLATFTNIKSVSCEQLSKLFNKLVIQQYKLHHLWSSAIWNKFIEHDQSTFAIDLQNLLLSDNLFPWRMMRPKGNVLIYFEPDKNEDALITISVGLVASLSVVLGNKVVLVCSGNNDNQQLCDVRKFLDEFGLNKSIGVISEHHISNMVNMSVVPVHSVVVFGSKGLDVSTIGKESRNINLTCPLYPIWINNCLPDEAGRLLLLLVNYVRVHLSPTKLSTQ